MSALRTEITIDAPADLVWAILTDFRNYGRWNPFIRAIDGRARRGSTLQVTTQRRGAAGTTRRNVLMKVDAPRELRWRSGLQMPLFLELQHGFRIDPHPDGGVLFRQSRLSRGLLAPLLRDGSDAAVERAFNEMNAALKARAEKAHREASTPRTAAQQADLEERTTRLNNALSWQT